MEFSQSYSAGESYWLARREEMCPPIAETAWLNSRLEDEQSKECLQAVLNARAKCDVRLLPDPVVHQQYLPNDVPICRDEVSFVDGGAYCGESLLNLQAGGMTFRNVMAFEPDLSNYSKLCSRMAEFSPTDSMPLVPCGLGEASQVVSFRQDGLASGLTVDDGDATALFVPLDAIYHRELTYIKLDVEGAEAAALKGARSLIATHRPAIEVSIYHRPEDLWMQPRLVDEMLPAAAFYLWAHGHNGFDLVLYAIPDPKCS